MEQKPAKFVGGPLHGRVIDVEFPFREELRTLCGVAGTGSSFAADGSPFRYEHYRLTPGGYYQHARK